MNEILKAKQILTILVISFPLAFCNVIETPQNVAVYVGRRMSFKCKTSNGFIVREWFLYRSSSDKNEKKIIWSNWNEKNPNHQVSRYSLNVDKNGSGELYLNDAQMEDAGRYTCTVEENEHTPTIHYGADLIVLESEPKCTLTESSDLHIEAECTVVFSGNWTPKMEWRQHQKGVSFEEGSVFTIGIDTDADKTHVTSKLTAVVLKSGKGSYSVSCKTYFDRGNETYPPGSVSNVPSLAYIWNSSVSDSKDATFEDAVSSSSRVGLFVGLQIGFLCAVILLIGALTYFIRKIKKRTQLRGTFRDVSVRERETEEGASNAVIAEAIEYADASEALTATVVPSDENLYSRMVPDRHLPVNAIYTELVNVKSLSTAIENEDSSDKTLDYVNFGDIQTTERL